VRPEPLLSFRSDSYYLGHYARKGWSVSEKTSTLRAQLLRSSDRTKDQNYYLSSMPERALARTLFPLGHMTKKQVRELAIQAKLPTAQREESMGICFVGEKRKFNDFLGMFDLISCDGCG
jgi:tRNA U34 2-thiouridine synthase MnmA/TrmU